MACSTHSLVPICTPVASVPYNTLPFLQCVFQTSIGRQCIVYMCVIPNILGPGKFAGCKLQLTNCARIISTKTDMYVQTVNSYLRMLSVGVMTFDFQSERYPFNHSRLNL